MGIIKDGKISGNLPTSSRKAFVVHYPAYPSSIDRAVETLGGTEAIAKVRSSESNKLELHFRPEDPFSHPAFGELHTCNNFLLRISKNKLNNARDIELSNRVSSSSADPATLRKNETCSGLVGTSLPVSGPETEIVASSAEVESQVLEEQPENLSADVVACIKEAYHFNGMVDYQHVIAVHADAARRKKRNWAEFENCSLMDVDQEDLMILVPPLFSLKDKPERLVLKPRAYNISKIRQEDISQHHWKMDIEPSLALDFKIKDIPKKVNWEKYIPEDSEQWVLQKTVCELFDERPIWVKESLSERLHDKGLEFGENMLKRLLFRAAYYFSTGPFRRFWIRKGYDPRKDPESRIYQRTDFHVPPPLRSYCDASAAPGLKHRWEDICAFRVFPYKCQTSLQFFELADDYIQEEIRKPSKLETCCCITGWFSPNVLETLRLRVAVRLLSVYPKAGAEAILKSASSHFEKSKRMCMYPKNVKVNEERQHANGEVVDEIIEKEPNDDDDDDDEEDQGEDDEDLEDDIQDGNNEEYLDAYEDLDPVESQEGNFSPQQDSYTDSENMSRNYLQDLFGSFPFDAASDKAMPDGNVSDEEYEIYEDCSDGNYSDGDEY